MGQCYQSYLQKSQPESQTFSVAFLPDNLVLQFTKTWGYNGNWIDNIDP